MDVRRLIRDFSEAVFCKEVLAWGVFGCPDIFPYEPSASRKCGTACHSFKDRSLDSATNYSAGKQQCVDKATVAFCAGQGQANYSSIAEAVAYTYCDRFACRVLIERKYFRRTVTAGS
jgi:hypothetical protein